MDLSDDVIDQLYARAFESARTSPTAGIDIERALRDVKRGAADELQPAGPTADPQHEDTASL